MVDLAIARLLHVLGVVIWIGGVAMVTLVVLLTAQDSHAPRRFGQVEHRIAHQMRWIAAIVALSGLYLVYRLNIGERFASAHFWWMQAMVVLWLAYAVVLDILEPLF